MFGWKYTSCHFRQTFQPCSWMIPHTHTPRNSKFKAKQVWLLHKYQWNHHVRGLQLQNSCTIFLFLGQLALTLVSPLKPSMLSSCVCETQLQKTDENEMFTLSTLQSACKNSHLFRSFFLSPSFVFLFSASSSLICFSALLFQALSHRVGILFTFCSTRATSKSAVLFLK